MMEVEKIPALPAAHLIAIFNMTPSPNITDKIVTRISSDISGEISNEVGDLHFAKPNKDVRIVVAMSGGVDSSLVAAILKDQGYEVIGITLQLYDHGSAIHKKGACCAGQDIHDARRVAHKLGIPHYVLDYESRFSDTVITDFVDSYLAGETPIPCVKCNQTVKFKDLVETAKELGADALATGHYIQSAPGADGWELMRAVDSDRDQSYFLFTTPFDLLPFLRFPLGGMTKARVRELARHYDLPVAEKSDSQDICFVPNGRYADVIEKLHPGALTPGDIVHMDGTILGSHDGIINYTIGQRRGLGIATGDPLFVVKINAAKNQVTVGPREALLTEKIGLRDVNWLGDMELFGNDTTGNIDIYAKVRSTQEPISANLYRTENNFHVLLNKGEYGVSPGQACVFYDGPEIGARILGGGWIIQTMENLQSRSEIRQELR